MTENANCLLQMDKQEAKCTNYLSLGDVQDLSISLED